MRRQIVHISVAALAAGLLSVAAFGQAGEPGPEHYSATWMVTGGGAGGTTVPIDIRITKYNTDAEIGQYASILAKDGPAGLRKIMEKQDVGQLSPVGRVGTTMAAARKVVDGDKTYIRALTLRNLSFAELNNGARSVDYPYTIVEMTVDKDGNGMGTAIGAAKIRFDKKKNIYEIESYGHGTAYSKLVNVRLQK